MNQTEGTDTADTKPDRRVMVLWSGGCDSTRVLHQALAEAREKGEAPPTAVTVRWTGRAGEWGKSSVAFSPVPAGPEQLLARQRFVDAMKHTYEFWNGTLDVGYGPGICIGGDFDGLPQPVMWLLPALMLCPPGCEIRTGWTMGDDVWAYMGQIERMVDAVSKIQGRAITLVHPLRSERKADTIEYLRRWHLLPLCWWCERPITNDTKDPAGSKACGSCRSCEAHDAATFLLDRRAAATATPQTAEGSD